MTQEEIYNLVKYKPIGWELLMDAAKQKGLIIYDHDEYWYRPTEDIGKVLDADLYYRYFGSNQ